MSNINPFSFAKASDYTDEEINSLWVDINKDKEFVESIIEPNLKISKFILGGKGTGKTHILRHYSYFATKLRNKEKTGLDVIQQHKSIGVFLRANALDASRFLMNNEDTSKWQYLFGVYFELKLAEDLINILLDVKETTPNTDFNDLSLIHYMAKEVTDDKEFNKLKNLDDLKIWIHSQIKLINDAINYYAFTNEINIKPPFSIGNFSIKIKNGINLWHPSLVNIPLIYLIDEVENFFSEEQQQVINSLIRYSSGLVTFRVSGRLYAIKTYATIGNGEENREDVEFKKVYLDEILQETPNYKEFCHSFVRERLIHEKIITDINFNISHCFDSIKTIDYYKDFIDFLKINEDNLNFINKFRDTLKEIPQVIDQNDIENIINILTSDFPILLKKLNLIRFCKEFKSDENYLDTATNVRSQAEIYLKTPKDERVKTYKESYSHYAKDLIAQLNKDSSKPMIYCGFDNFIDMSSGNPRNLLNILSSAYEFARFKKLDFINGAPLSIENQSKAVVNSAKFIFEQDSNFGRPSDLAKIAVRNIGELLREARFSLNIPESSPLTISFSDDDLTPNAKSVLQSALNYSFVFEIKSGRPDRNSMKISRKISLNPMLSPIWELPIGKRGDIGLSATLANAIFEREKIKDFNHILKSYSTKWNQPFTRNEQLLKHNDFFN